MSTIVTGSRVRSFDFASHDLAGERACYIEGVVTGLPHIEGCTRYAIAVDRVVIGGKERPARTNHVATPPVNGTPIWGDPDDLTNGVELI